MKKLIVLLAMLLAMGCAAIKHKPMDVCERLDKEKGDVFVATSMIEEEQYMYWVGYQISERMKANSHEPVKVSMNMAHRNITVIGEIDWDQREDGLYLCETSCDIVDGKVTKKRENTCAKIGD